MVYKTGPLIGRLQKRSEENYIVMKTGPSNFLKMSDPVFSGRMKTSI